MASLSPAQRHQILVEWNDTRSQDVFKVGLHHVVRTRALRHGSAWTVDDGSQCLSLEEVVRRASGLAEKLKRLGVGREDVVALYLQPTVAMAWAALGILESRAACLPLDPSAPTAHLLAILKDAAPRVLLVADLPPKEISNSWEFLDVRTVQPVASPPPLLDPEFSLNHLAYVFYPDTEQEVPLGVEVSHRMLTNLARHVQRNLGLRPEDHVRQATALHCESCAGELWAALTHAAHLKVAPASVRTSSETLRLWLAQESVQTPPPGRRNAGNPPFLHSSPDSRLYLLDRELEPVPLGSEGELFFAGGFLPRGFRGRPALTGCRFFPNPYCRTVRARSNEELVFETGDRLFRTGWRGRFRPDGTVQILGEKGRSKKNSLFFPFHEGKDRLFSPQ